MLLVMVAIASDPPRMLLLVGLAYVASGPALWAWRRLRRRQASA
jgi:CDP-diacylglycerol--serine O-phosphatidyltransferase